jgi:hypothetical protein
MDITTGKEFLAKRLRLARSYPYIPLRKIPLPWSRNSTKRISLYPTGLRISIHASKPSLGNRPLRHHPVVCKNTAPSSQFKPKPPTFLALDYSKRTAQSSTAGHRRQLIIPQPIIIQLHLHLAVEQLQTPDPYPEANPSPRHTKRYYLGRGGRASSLYFPAYTIYVVGYIKRHMVQTE